MDNENKSFGTAVIGHGTQFEKEVPIKSFCRVTFTDHRLCTTFKMENEGVDTYALVVENPPSTGREPINQMYISKDSLMGLLGSIIIHLHGEGIDLENVISEMTKGNQIEYYITPNLKPLQT